MRARGRRKLHQIFLFFFGYNLLAMVFLVEAQGLSCNPVLIATLIVTPNVALILRTETRTSEHLMAHY